MVFNSYQYALFLPIVLGLYWLLQDRKKQNILLLIASYVFYGAWDYRFLGLMWISTLTDFTVGRLLRRETDERRRKRIFFVSLVVNLGILGFFKYFDFFSTSSVALLRHLGVHADVPTLRIILPIGISFYTFHGISYTFDVFRREIEPTRNLLDFACFVAFFPQLVSGPIGRAQVQLPQFENPRTKPDREQVQSGLFLILLGLFKKVAIADALAPFVDKAFASSHTASAPTLIMGAFGFLIQVFGDLSGYSDMARGSSRLFGIELLKNFEQPYLSRNFTEFWRTWHISLSTWLRDYLYVPLGGNRGGWGGAYRNLIITMTLAGLWHGAGWNFVMWGVTEGLFLAVHRAWSRRPSVRSRASASVGVPGGADSIVRTERPVGLMPPFVFSRDFLPMAFTISLHTASLIIFRCPTLHASWHYFQGIITLRSGPTSGDFAIVLLIATAVVYAIDLVQRNTGSETPVLGWSVPARALVFASFVVPIIIFSGGTPVPFIYFQF